MDKVKLKIGRAQFNRDIFPEKYTKENKMGLYSQEEKAQALASAFNRSSNLWLDFSPFSGGEKQEKDAVLAAGLAFKPNWFVTFVAEGSQGEQHGRIMGTGKGVAEESIPDVFNIGGESADESLGYHIRFHVVGEGSYRVRAELPLPDGRVLADEVEFKVS